VIEIETLIDKYGTERIKTSLLGNSLMACPVLNKGTAFTRAEREAFSLGGLLPHHVRTLEEQAGWAYEEFRRRTTDLDRHIFLRALQDNIETVFYRLVLDHVTEMMPLVYTPTVGAACQEFSHIYRRGRGLFIPYPESDRIDRVLDNRPYLDVDVIVVSDGERILGLGDLGAGGMGIPIGKLSLYTLCAGLHPARTLPILLDSGTDNPALLEDPLYLGWRHERVRGTEYDDFIEAFVDAVMRRLPNALLQWEDFSRDNARPILDRYRDKLLTFNDDIQGTGAVVLGALLAAVGLSNSRVRDQDVVIAGAGSAAVGIADAITSLMVSEESTDDDARARIWLVKSNGLVHEGLDGLAQHQSRYARSLNTVSEFNRASDGTIGLDEVIKKVHPSVLIGVSGQEGLFREEIVREMAAHVDRPIIFALSNPTSCSEATPQDLVAWTENRAIIAAGSPFPPVEYMGRTIHIGQCNNAYVFPGVGLGAIASGANRITNEMFMAASRALSALSPALADPGGPLLPRLEEIRSISAQVAVAVGLQGQQEGVAPSTTTEELERSVNSRMWLPRYLPLER
jgi:malate dehydrogenase (oxaloacetate-decarboxylating)